MSFGLVLQHSLNPSVTLLNWVKVAVCTPTPIHRQCTQTFSPPQKTNALLGIEPAAPPPSQSPSRDVNPLHQSTTYNLRGRNFASEQRISLKLARSIQDGYTLWLVALTQFQWDGIMFDFYPGLPHVNSMEWARIDFMPQELAGRTIIVSPTIVMQSCSIPG